MSSPMATRREQDLHDRSRGREDGRGQSEEGILQTVTAGLFRRIAPTAVDDALLSGAVEPAYKVRCQFVEYSESVFNLQGGTDSARGCQPGSGLRLRVDDHTILLPYE